MNIIKNYIRNKIAELIEWAIGAQIDGIKESIMRNGSRVTTLQQEQKKLRRTIEYVTDVAIDHNPTGFREKSWAVICTHGKKGKNTVKFYRLHDDYIDTLHKLIKEFGAEGMLIDTHPQINKDLCMF